VVVRALDGTASDPQALLAVRRVIHPVEVVAEVRPQFVDGLVRRFPRWLQEAQAVDYGPRVAGFDSRDLFASPPTCGLVIVDVKRPCGVPDPV